MYKPNSVLDLLNLFKIYYISHQPFYRLLSTANLGFDQFDFLQFTIEIPELDINYMKLRIDLLVIKTSHKLS